MHERTVPEDLSAYDMPSTRSQIELGRLGSDEASMIRSRDVHHHFTFAFTYFGNMLHRHSESGLTNHKVTQLQAVVVSLFSSALEGNPYPGKDFNIEDAKAIATRAKDVTWTPENAVTEYDTLKAMFDKASRL